MMPDIMHDVRGIGIPMNYDRLYDMRPRELRYMDARDMAKCPCCIAMRGPRFELGRLAAPDPKSDPIAGNDLASECGRATQRHGALPNDTTSTTDFATSDNFPVPSVVGLPRGDQ